MVQHPVKMNVAGSSPAEAARKNFSKGELIGSI